MGFLDKIFSGGESKKDKLKTIALSHNASESERRDAIDKIADFDQDFLLEIVNNSDSGNIFIDSKLYAMSKIKDESILVDYALNPDLKWNLRSCALNHIEDEKALEKFALNTTNSTDGNTAVLKIQNEEIIKNIAQNAKYDEVRESAVRHKLSDKNILEDIKNNDSSEVVRESAAKKLDKLN